MVFIMLFTHANHFKTSKYQRHLKKEMFLICSIASQTYITTYPAVTVTPFLTNQLQCT